MRVDEFLIKLGGLFLVSIRTRKPLNFNGWQIVIIIIILCFTYIMVQLE